MTYPVNNIIKPFCLLNKFILWSAHVYICEIGSSSSAHCGTLNTGNIGQIPTWVKLGSNLGNNNSQLLKLGYSWGKVGFYFKS